MILHLIIHFIYAFFGTIGFSAMFRIPVRELGYGGATGGIGWVIYQLIILNLGLGNANLGVFIATLIVTAISRFLAFNRKKPVTIFLVSGVIPFVPGAGIYHTMANLVSGDNMLALAKGIETLTIAGLIAGGIMFVLALPSNLFHIKISN